MKTAIAIFVFGIGALALGAVNFTAADKGDGTLFISYTTTEDDLPCAVALRVEISGDGMVDPANPGVTHPAFNTYVDYLYSDLARPLIDDNGHPLAKADMAGELEEPASVFSICAAVLDQSGNQAPGPDNGVLIELPIQGGETVTISADTLRGPDSGVVGHDGVIESNLPIMVEIGGLECPYTIAAAKPYLDADLDVSCWCCPYQCRGDIMCDRHILGYVVYTTDLAALAASWKAKIGDANLNPCADIARDKHILGYRVYTTDLAILAENWKKKPGDLEVCGDN